MRVKCHLGEARWGEGEDEGGITGYGRWERRNLNVGVNGREERSSLKSFSSVLSNDASDAGQVDEDNIVNELMRRDTERINF